MLLCVALALSELETEQQPIPNLPKVECIFSWKTGGRSAGNSLPSEEEERERNAIHERAINLSSIGPILGRRHDDCLASWSAAFAKCTHMEGKTERHRTELLI